MSQQNNPSHKAHRTLNARDILCRASLITLGILSLNITACSKQTDSNNAKADALPVKESPVAKAAAQGNLAEIRAQLEAGEGIDVKDALGRTPLHMAAFYGRPKTTELLLAKGEDINAKDNVGITPLHVAVLSGGKQEVEILAGQ